MLLTLYMRAHLSPLICRSTTGSLSPMVSAAFGVAGKWIFVIATVWPLRCCSLESSLTRSGAMQAGAASCRQRPAGSGPMPAAGRRSWKMSMDTGHRLPQSRLRRQGPADGLQMASAHACLAAVLPGCMLCLQEATGCSPLPDGLHRPCEPTLTTLSTASRAPKDMIAVFTCSKCGACLCPFCHVHIFSLQHLLEHPNPVQIPSNTC